MNSCIRCGRPEILNRDNECAALGCPYQEGLIQRVEPTKTSLNKIFVDETCTEEEQGHLKIYLFLLRNKNINFNTLEGIIKKYEDILKH